MKTVCIGYEGDYGHELSPSQIEEFENCKSDKEVYDLAYSLSDNVKIQKSSTGYIFKFFSDNWYIMFSIYVII